MHWRVLQFEAIWQAIKGWDIQRTPGAGYAGATGTDVMTILNALRRARAPEQGQRQTSGETTAACGCRLRALPDGSIDQVWCAKHSRLAESSAPARREEG